jgi:hypothetical protein
VLLATRVGCVAVAALFTVSSQLRSQQPSANPTGSEVAALLRAHGNSWWAVSVLTQARGPQPIERLDEIADSLVAIAVSFPGMDFRGVTTRSAALSALASAGMGESGVVGMGHATPYAGAADRLMRIAEDGGDVGLRAAALWSLTKLPNKSKLLPFLRQVAESQNSAAFSAVTLLAQETGPEGRSMARELYLNGQITEPVAKHVAASFAGAYQWR